jgi:predicted secreted protein
MATYSGQDGHVKIGTYEVAEMASWNLTISANEIAINVFGTSWTKTEQGIKSWSCSLDGFYDLSDTNGQVAIKNAFWNNTLLTTVRLYVNDTSYWTPDLTTDSSAGARVTNYSPTQTADNVAQVSISLAGSGPITFV